MSADNQARLSAIEDIITFLTPGGKVSEKDLRACVLEALERVTYYAENQAYEQWLLKESAAREKVLMAVESLQSALGAYLAVGDETCGVTCPIPENLDRDLEALRRWGHPLDWWLRNKPGRGKKKTGPSKALPMAVIAAHELAVDLLEMSGLTPTQGSSKVGKGTIAEVGALLCRGADIHLPAGESTAAAALVWKDGKRHVISHTEGRLWPYEPLPPLQP
ncbi:MAG: hypothetical protein Q8O00_07370 [Holophaga sp.]|nr:hypothetical protein [Holophaga sp.]